MNLTDVAEGTIVRCITRLDEVCREVRDAARVIGDAELFRKMEEAQALIRRDSESFSFGRASEWMTDCFGSCLCCELVFLRLPMLDYLGWMEVEGIFGQQFRFPDSHSLLIPSVSVPLVP